MTHQPRFAPVVSWHEQHAQPSSLQDLAPVDAGAFRRAFRQLAGGVSVVTAGRGADRTGFAATSVSSLSAEPPTLMFAVNLSSSSFPVLERDRVFGVNILSADQEDVAARFSGWGGARGEERYAGATWRTAVTGVYLLEGALATFDCSVEEILVRHTHAIVIGRILDIAARATPAAALTYVQGQYTALGWSSEDIERATHFR